MGLTVQPEGKVLKIIESNRARESAIPIYGGDDTPPTQDQYVTRLLRARARQPRRREGGARSLEEPSDGDITVYAPTNTLVITDLGAEHPPHGGGGQAARRADGRREDLGHQAAHRVGDRDGDDAVERSSASPRAARRRRAPGARRREPRRARPARAGAGRRRASRAAAATRSVGVADHPRRSAATC